jgi:diguanylate cyclase (GGDEF)-like protein
LPKANRKPRLKTVSAKAAKPRTSNPLLANSPEPATGRHAPARAPHAGELVRLATATVLAPTQHQDAVLTNKSFNLYLNITARDKALLRKHRKALHRGAHDFAKVFYDYLLQHAATTQVLLSYQQAGGHIEHLVERQTEHLHQLLDANTGKAQAARITQIGHIHYRYQIAPVWIMGAYLKYLDHLLTATHRIPRIKKAEAAHLEDAIHKLLFRDMGLMLEGYWLASRQALVGEHEKLGELQNQVNGLLSNIPQLLWSVDVVHNKPLYISPAARRICNTDIELPIPCLGWTVPEERERVQRAWERAVAGERIEVETRVQEPGKPIRWFRRLFCPYRNAQGEVTRIDGIMEDITDAHAMTDRLQRLATTDALTGLPNRTLFADRVSQAISATKRENGRRVALMLMDLDHFKEINDTLGHAAGDEVLMEVARRLSQVLRDGDTLTRLGGDEFAILLPNAENARHAAESVAQKILQRLSSPVTVADNELYLGASMGIALYPDNGLDVQSLLSHADVAMYACKNRDTRYAFYEDRLDTDVPTRLRLSGELRHALERHELELHYQPIVDLKSGRPSGIEALIRWRHPTRGLIAPDEFLPLAERSGQIKAITDWVIDTALTQCEACQREHGEMRVAVNVSARAFQDPKFAERLEHTLARRRLSPRCLEIEVTENMLMSDVEHVSRLLRQLAALGIRIAIDDFGTGYSSLAYLKQLPLDRLKIDKSFVLDMLKDDNDAIIVKTIIDLAHNLGREVVAEGIENEDTHDLLDRLGCDGAQGFHIGRPMPAVELMRWLQTRAAACEASKT